MVWLHSTWTSNIAKLVATILAVSCVSPSKLRNKLYMAGQPHYMEGIDISNHQKAINWEQCTPGRSGKDFVIAKATEGATYQDPMFGQNVSGARAAGFSRIGGYHFVRFGSSAPTAQMDNFVRQISDVGLLEDKEAIIALDVEEHTMADYTIVGSVVEICVRYLKAMHITPYIYTRTSFWNAHVAVTPDIVKECPLWIARWRDVPPSPEELPRGWDLWTIWQYASKGQVPGIIGDVDLNRMIR
ncbi:glycoside hydrolase family 25 protein [Cardinium endosymbiont of Philonthus spinipes]|uniref:glycoside hydrolase family 25 protein n=1 Tax=Cardinium endosymbiont of Philonthus spinipes TaxID=3077941 RepID=UPI00313D9D81